MQTHCPELQICPPGHWWLQVPQLAPSVCKLTQVPPHDVCPLGQQMPAEQTKPAEHALPQPPQLRASVVRSVQALEQQLWPVVQRVHVPFGPPPQTIFVSLAGGTQVVPLQQPVEHEELVHTHCPLLHVWPAEQACPQVPQLEPSF